MCVGGGGGGVTSDDGLSSKPSTKELSVKFLIHKKRNNLKALSHA